MSEEPTPVLWIVVVETQAPWNWDAERIALHLTARLGDMGKITSIGRADFVQNPSP